MEDVKFVTFVHLRFPYEDIDIGVEQSPCTKLHFFDTVTANHVRTMKTTESDYHWVINNLSATTLNEILKLIYQSREQ